LPLLLKTSRQVRDAQVPFEHYRICKMYSFNTTVLCICCRWDSDVLHAAHESHANELNSPLLSDLDLALQKAVAQLLQ